MYSPTTMTMMTMTISSRLFFSIALFFFVTIDQDSFLPLTGRRVCIAFILFVPAITIDIIGNDKVVVLVFVLRAFFQKRRVQLGFSSRAFVVVQLVGHPADTSVTTPVSSVSSISSRYPVAPICYILYIVYKYIFRLCSCFLLLSKKLLMLHH
jgi:hypothetical protein